MTAFTNRMPVGFAGAISRPTAPLTVEAQVLGTTQFASYGIPAKLSGNTVIPVSANADVVYGFLVRPYPTQDYNQNPAVGTTTPATPGNVGGIMRRGYMIVKCNAGTPAIGGAVYVRYANPSGSLVVGGLEATSVGGSNYAITGAQFMGPADANGNVEISFGGPNS